MKVLCVLWMFLALPLVSLGEEKLVPEAMKLKMNVHLNAWNVKLHVDQGGVVYMVAGHLFVWGSQQEAMKLADEDQMPLVMAKVLQEAKHGRSYEKVVWNDIQGIGKTRVESSEKDGVWGLQITRDEKTARYSVKEVEKLLTILKDLRAASAWYSKLFAASSIPEMTDEAYPLHSENLHLFYGDWVTLEGEKSCRILVGYSSYQRASYSVGLFFSGGKRARGFDKEWMDAIQKALDAIEKGEDYQFKTEHKTESTYELVVKEGKLEMTIYPAIYAVIHDQPVKLQFSKDELERLTKASNKVTQRMEWIEKNMTLFFRKK